MGMIPQENLSIEALKAERKKKSTSGKAKAVKDKSLRAVFRSKLLTIEIEKLRKPWMASKSLVLLDTAELLKEYVDSILNDRSLWQQPYYNKPDVCPVVAVDTETYGLDTRVMVDFELHWNEELGREVCFPIYELNIEIAGVCLSADGIKAVYIPLLHEEGNNVSLEYAREQLQRLFDQAHLLFYNAKFDREVMRQTLGIVFRDYPHFEDIQVLHFSNDPKAELDGDEFIGGGGDGLKGLSKTLLEMEQIELGEIGKVKAHVSLTEDQQEEIRLRPEWIKLNKNQAWNCAACARVQAGNLCVDCGNKTTKKGCKSCGIVLSEVVPGCESCLQPVTQNVCAGCGEAATQLRVQTVKAEDGSETIERHFECAKPECSTKVVYKKTGLKMQYVPFSWVPPSLAVIYAAPDALCTWLIWAHKPKKLNPDDPEPEVMHIEAQKRPAVHKIDGQLVDTLTWMERQRLYVDTERHARLVKWSARANEERRQKLVEIANRHGWQQSTDDDGVPIGDTVFNVDSPIDLPKLLFDIKGFRATKFTETGKRSCDADALVDLYKLHPHDEFLLALKEYKEYVALHPEKLSWDKRDNTARIYLKQSTVAGGRLAASGGKFDRDGGVNMNIQAIKKVGGNWWVKGDVLVPDAVDEADVEPREESDLDPSCFLTAKKDEIVSKDGDILSPDDPAYAESAAIQGYELRNGKWSKKAPGILKNHIANYLGYAMCLVPGCKSCAEKHGILIPKTKLDANQIINLRALFVARKGWTFLTTDYSNIEVRVAANISGETELQHIFLFGDGDHHSLTASKVFPEWHDPSITKAEKKELRGRAKIINFALQYGGTEYTIFENLKELIPGITLKKTREMVDAYWKGVPRFAEWSQNKQAIAREQMICTTTTGRIIKFKSAMDALRIHEPTPAEKDNLLQYYRIRKAFRLAEEKALESKSEEDKAAAASLKKHMDMLYDDRDTGVRNGIEHNRFMGKIQRVSVNAPVQGLAGDFMRIALNKIRLWATVDCPLVQSVLLVHNSVHDEIDYAVKNPYLPFVVPRITRLMKLRRLHAAQNWPVGIEADTEYGSSWDVAFHLTGDDGHKPSGWTDVDGMEEYLPAGFTLEGVARMVKAIASGNERLVEKARTWCEQTLHKRANDAAKAAFDYADPAKHAEPNLAGIRKQLIAAIQLHEYWTIDAVMEGDKVAELETLEAFEARCGLTEADRGFMPEGGWLYSVPLDRVRRKAVPVLGPAPVTTPDDPTPGDDEDEEVEQGSLFPDETDYHEPDDSDLYDDAEPSGYETPDEAPVDPPVRQVKEDPMPIPDPTPAASPVTEDDLMMPAPKKREAAPAPAPTPVIAVPDTSHIPVLKDDLLESEAVELYRHLNPSVGYHTVEYLYMGELCSVPRCFRNTIPAKFLKHEANHG